MTRTGSGRFTPCAVRHPGGPAGDLGRARQIANHLGERLPPGSHRRPPRPGGAAHVRRPPGADVGSSAEVAPPRPARCRRRTTARPGRDVHRPGRAALTGGSVLSGQPASSARAAAVVVDPGDDPILLNPSEVAREGVGWSGTPSDPATGSGHRHDRRARVRPRRSCTTHARSSRGPSSDRRIGAYQGPRAARRVPDRLSTGSRTRGSRRARRAAGIQAELLATAEAYLRELQVRGHWRLGLGAAARGTRRRAPPAPRPGARGRAPTSRSTRALEDQHLGRPPRPRQSRRTRPQRTTTPRSPPPIWETPLGSATDQQRTAGELRLPEQFTLVCERKTAPPRSASCSSTSGRSLRFGVLDGRPVTWLPRCGCAVARAHHATSKGPELDVH